MNILQSPAAAEMRKLLRQYVETNGPSLGKSFFSGHVREIERALMEEIDREVKAGGTFPKKSPGGSEPPKTAGRH